MSTYRNIYKQHYGSIPKEENGRSYEIHHIDGNHNNNDISNLQCVTIQEHYNLHYAQGDWGACLLMSNRMNISPEEKSKLASKQVQHQLATSNHPFQGKNNHCHKRVEDGTHLFQNKEWQSKQGKKAAARSTNYFKYPEKQKQWAQERVTNGTHHFLGGEVSRAAALRRLADGTHPSQGYWKCIHCGKEGKHKAMHTRYHGDKCKFNKSLEQN